jgi:hypothetical protein
MKARKAIFVVVLLVLGAAMWAQSYDDTTVVYKITREQLSGYLKYLGYAPSNVKERTISMKLAGYSTFISVNGSDLQIYAWFSGPADPDLVNKFNATYRFASAYWDEENDICVQCDIDMEGGITLGAISEWIKTYATLLDDWNSLE